MPFFFHLKLELYPAPASASSEHHFDRRSKSKQPSEPFVPLPGTDIFTSTLPARKTHSWTSPTSSKPSGGRSTHTSSPAGSPRPDQHSELVEQGHGRTLLLPERTANRKEHSPGLKTGREIKPSNEAAARDYRYGKVVLEGVNMEVSSTQQNNSGGVRPAAGKAGANGLHTKAVYVPSEPKTTEVGWGVVRLYRDTEESPILSGDAAASAGKQATDATNFDSEQCTTLAILAVPSWMMPSDLLGFVGDQAREDVSHFRLIRTERTNKYMALLKFRSAKKAREWQALWNGRLFSAAEPENCHVVFIKSVDFLTPDTEETIDTENKFPQNNSIDPFTPSSIQSTRSVTDKSQAQTLSSKPLAPPPPNLLELPTCPVCLERMDETTGLLTILCQHVFHCACIEKWRFPGSGCPVCRYTQNPSYTFPYPRPGTDSTDAESGEDPMCSVCAGGAQEVTTLWVCLICGNVGCGRYDGRHAFQHYEETSHCYAMDIATQHVWDYAGDGYVHRLIQSKPDLSSTSDPTPAQAGKGGKGGTQSGLIDVGAGKASHVNGGLRVEAEDTVPREKMEAMANEYTYLLTSQLEGQRRYFEEQVERAVDKATLASSAAETASTAAEKANQELETMQIRYASLESSISGLEKSLDKSEKARSKFEALSRDMSKKLREEQVQNEGLLERIKAADVKAEEANQAVEAAKAEKEGLEEMNRDLTMFISGQEKVKELEAQGEEVVDGSAFVPEQQQGKGKGKKKRR